MLRNLRSRRARSLGLSIVSQCVLQCRLSCTAPQLLCLDCLSQWQEEQAALEQGSDGLEEEEEGSLPPPEPPLTVALLVGGPGTPASRLAAFSAAAGLAEVKLSLL